MDTLGSSSIYFCSMGISVLRPAFTWKMEGAKPKIVSGTVPNKKKDKNSIKLLNNHMQGVLKASASTLMPPHPRVRGYRHQGRKL